MTIPEKIALIKRKVYELFENIIVAEAVEEGEAIATEKLPEQIETISSEELIEEVEAMATEELPEQIEAIATCETENQLEVRAVEIKQSEDQEKTDLIEDWPYIEDEIENEEITTSSDFKIYTTVNELKIKQCYEIYSDKLDNAIVLKYSGDNWLTDIKSNRSMLFDDIAAKFPDFKLVEFSTKTQTLTNLEGAAIELIFSRVTNKPHSIKIESYRNISECKKIGIEIQLHGYCNNYKIEQDPWDKDIRNILLFELNISKINELCNFLDKCYKQYPTTKKSRKIKNTPTTKTQEIEGQLALI